LHGFTQEENQGFFLFRPIVPCEFPFFRRYNLIPAAGTQNDAKKTDIFHSTFAWEFLDLPIDRTF
jgi:hypothetical protein